MKKIMFLIVFFLAISCKNQKDGFDARVNVKELTIDEKARYSSLKKEALDLYNSKDYLKSAKKYNEAIRLSGKERNIIDNYNAACSWALAKEVDSAFVRLFYLVRGDYTDYTNMVKDSDFYNLHSDKRWTQMLEKIKINKEKLEANFDKTLIALLDTIRNDDQGLRSQIKEVQKKYGNDSNEIKTFYKKIQKKDSINIIKIQKILNENGWLGKDIIGEQGNATLFMVIQHANLEMQEKYLPMARKAARQGNLKLSHLALLEDRIAMRKGERQIYGSQLRLDEVTGLRYFYPIKDPDNVDKRRAEMGLELIKDYASIFEIDWDLETYKQQLPTLEKKLKITK